MVAGIDLRCVDILRFKSGNWELKGSKVLYGNSEDEKGEQGATTLDWEVAPDPSSTVTK